MKALWTICGSILFAGTIWWGGYNVATLLGHDTYSERVVYDGADVRSIDVDNSAGGITVTGTDAATASNEITLVAKISNGIRETENSHEVIDGVLTVRASCPVLGSAWCGASYTLEVPHDLAVELHADNDGIRVTGLDGTVRAESDNGSVRLDALSGDVVAESDNGTIRADRMTSEAATFATDNGDVRVQFETPPTSVTATTSNGSITIHVPRPDAYDVSTSTDNGSTSVDVTDDPTSGRTIDASTDNGSITIVYRN